LSKNCTDKRRVNHNRYVGRRTYRTGRDKDTNSWEFMINSLEFLVDNKRHLIHRNTSAKREARIEEQFKKILDSVEIQSSSVAEAFGELLEEHDIDSSHE